MSICKSLGCPDEVSAEDLLLVETNILPQFGFCVNLPTASELLL